MSLLAARRLNRLVEEREGQEAFQRLIRNKAGILQLFQSEAGKVLIEYLLSEKNSALDDIIYVPSETSQHRISRLQGKIQMIDAILGLAATLDIKLKEFELK